MDFKLARSNMIEQQIRPWDVLDQRVLDVLSDVPREEFVLPTYRGLAYSDFQLPIGHGQTLFKPIVEGRLLQSLLLQPGDKVLEIGTGSGYLSTCLARLSAHVDSLEIVPELAYSAELRLQNLGIANVSIRQQDASRPGEPREAFDAIVFGGAIARIPDDYCRQLQIGGRLFAIIGDASQPTMEAVLLTRVRDDEWQRESLFETQVASLQNFTNASPRFVF